MSVMDTALRESLKTLRLPGMPETLDARLAQAFSGDPGRPSLVARRRVRHPLRPGRGRKTHVAQALGHLAVRHGVNVRFAKTSRTLAELADGHADRTREKRISELVRPDPAHPRRLRHAPS
ncbi:ATP-binding protein [Streptomyces cuspidosporus]|uniref:ATP-binding protein n=1 Tax=Streptomyces cuspidosporus TaxID=66882 RepID=UPI0031FDCDD1